MNEGENHQICDIIQNGFANIKDFLNTTEVYYLYIIFVIEKE